VSSELNQEINLTDDYEQLHPAEDPGAQPAVDDPYDGRPNLSDLGIVEHERGVCEDTYENRNILRRANLRFQAVYDVSGRATNLISTFTKDSIIERRILSLAEKRPLLVDPDNRNSDYLTGVDLILEESVHEMVPPWVLGATRGWIAEQNAGGPISNKREPKGLPHRCRIIKQTDGIRCMLWGSGRRKDDGVCRIHLRTGRTAGESVERARRKLVQAAPYAVDVLEELMDAAESEPVRLKASTEILDRAGIRGGQDINIEMEVTDARPAAQIVMERLQRLAEGAAAVQARLEIDNNTDGEIVDAEVIEESPEPGTGLPVEHISDISDMSDSVESTVPGAAASAVTTNNFEPVSLELDENELEEEASS
jgi:hypothetical protein